MKRSVRCQLPNPRARRALALPALIFLCLGSFPSSLNAALLVALDTVNQRLYQIDTANIGSPTLIGTVVAGTDLYELCYPASDRYYTFDRDANLLITVSSANASVISSVPLDQDAFVTRRGFDLSPSGVLYGLLPGMQLRTINPLTGASTFIANVTGTPRVEAIAFAPDGTLFAVGTTVDDGSSENLYQMNPLTGVCTFIGATGVPDVDSLAFGSDGQLYGADSFNTTSAHLYRFNTLTGLSTDLGLTGVGGINGLVGIPEPSACVLLFALAPLASNRRRRSPSGTYAA